MNRADEVITGVTREWAAREAAREAGFMTVREVQNRVRLVREAAEQGDDERAHSLEDALRLDVLRAVARGPGRGGADPRGLAVEALKTQAIAFSRWAA